MGLVVHYDALFLLTQPSRARGGTGLLFEPDPSLTLRYLSPETNIPAFFAPYRAPFKLSNSRL